MYFIILRDSKFQSNSGVSHLFYKESIWRDSDITGFKLVSNQIKSWWNATLFLLKTFKWYLYNDFMKTLKTCDPLIYSQCPPGSNPRAECAWSSTRIAKIAKSEFTIAKSECEQASLPTTAHVQPHLGKYTLTIYPFSTCLQYTYYKSSYWKDFVRFLSPASPPLPNLVSSP